MTFFLSPRRHAPFPMDRDSPFSLNTSTNQVSAREPFGMTCARFGGGSHISGASIKRREVEERSGLARLTNCHGLARCGLSEADSSGRSPTSVKFANSGFVLISTC